MIYKGQITEKDGKAIMAEMCRRVGVDSDTFDFSQPEWYMTHTWTEAEQEDYHVWLGKFLEKQGYCRGKYRGQNHGYYEASKLIMNYGWKVEYDPRPNSDLA